MPLYLSNIDGQTYRSVGLKKQNNHHTTASNLRGGPIYMHGFWGLLSATFNEWMEDKAPRLGAALAYYTAFSIAPLLILLVRAHK